MLLGNLLNIINQIRVRKRQAHLISLTATKPDGLYKFTRSIHWQHWVQMVKMRLRKPFMCMRMEEAKLSFKYN